MPLPAERIAMDLDHHPELDRIDLRILRVLQADGRITNLKLAEQVHLSPTAVHERVKRLQREGYILGYEARLNPATSWAPRCWCSSRCCSTAPCTT
jgi:DNA-binding Lrp family transcriptional regulator